MRSEKFFKCSFFIIFVTNKYSKFSSCVRILLYDKLRQDIWGSWLPVPIVTDLCENQDALLNVPSEARRRLTIEHVRNVGSNPRQLIKWQCTPHSFYSYNMRCFVTKKTNNKNRKYLLVIRYNRQIFTNFIVFFLIVFC